MKTGAPWSIRGIDGDIRNAARRAAHRSGLSLADWLNDAIARQARADGIVPRWHQYDDENSDAEPDVGAVTAALQRLTRRIRMMDENARAALTDLHSRLDDIVQRLDAIAHLRGQPAAVAPSLRSVATIVDELSRDIDNADEKARSSVEGLRPRTSARVSESRVDRVAEAIRSLDARLSSMSQRIKSPIADEAPTSLDTIKSRLDSLLAGGAEPSTHDDNSLDATLRQLEAHVEEARDRLVASEGVTQPVSTEPDDDDRAHRTESRSGQIAGESRPPAEHISSVVAEISARQRSIDGHADLAELARGQRHISESLAALRAEATKHFSTQDARASQDEVVSARRLGFDTIAEGIAELTRLIKAADGRDAIAGLEARVDDLARAVDATRDAADLASASAADKTVGRLEGHLASIGGRIDQILGEAVPRQAIDEMRERLDAICGQLDELHSATHLPIAAIDEMRSALVDLRRELDDRQALGHDRLQNEIADLACRLDAAALPDAMALMRVEDDLSRLRGHLSDSREESVEVGRSAAREFVREMIGSSGEGSLLQALRTDLENIRVAASTADQRTQEALDSVHEMLARVVDRLTRLEADGVADATNLGAAVWATGTYGAAAPEPPIERRVPESRISKPDIAALRELARSAAHGQKEPAGDRKADYIAAARRATQTTADAATNTAAREPGAFARIGQAIRNRRTSLLLAAPMVIVTVAAVHFVADRNETIDLTRPHETPTVAAEAVATASEAEQAVATVPPPVSTVGKTSSTTAVGIRPAAIAFALPESRRSRFGAAPDAPPTTGFVRSIAFEMPLDEAIGSPSLREAAVTGDAAAAAELAARYAEGRLVRRDLSKAAYWYERAAERGNPIAQYRLASLYQRGEGVEANRATAATWYKQAADLGNVGAMHNLAVMMSDGVEEAPGYTEAVEYFRAAADRGVADSQYNLGVIYARGIGREKNLAASYKWFALAAMGGDAEAGDHRDEIGKLLSSDELAGARRAVAAWRPLPVIAEANASATPSNRKGLATTGISEADRRSLVRTIQTLLADQGYDPGPADGFDGPKTRGAVRAYQRKIGLAETGKISSDLVAALVDPSR